MNFLLIDGWGDYSVRSDDNRPSKTSPLFLYLANILITNNHNIRFIDARDFHFTYESLNEHLKYNGYDYIIFNTNVDNVDTVLRSQSRIPNQATKLYTYSINENFSDYIKNSKFKNLIFDERLNFKENAHNIYSSLFENAEVKFESSFVLNYHLYQDLKYKSVLLNIGTGCLRKCNYCGIGNSTVQYRDISNIMEEIKQLLDKGIQYFHISNHNFCQSKSFMEAFCKELIKRFHNRDFTWSCYILPEYFIEYIQLIPLMKEAKISKIEISCESGSCEILRQLNISDNTEQIKMITQTIMDNEIPLISYHFIMGSIFETVASLIETRKCIIELLEKTNYLCDIQINAFYPEYQDNPSIYQEIILKRTDFVVPSKSLSIEELKYSLSTLKKEIQVLRKANVPQIHLKRQHDFIRAKDYGINSQVYIENLAYTPASFMYRKKMQTKYFYYSWEIKDNIEEYSPFILSSDYIKPEVLKNDFSNLDRVLLVQLKYGLTILELATWLKKESNGTLGYPDLLKVLNNLENQKRICYVKYLK